MADCNSLETLMTTLTNEVATLKAEVATLKGKQNNFATKSDLERLGSELRRAIEAISNGIRDIVIAIVQQFLGGNNSGLEQRVTNLEIKVGGVRIEIDSIRRAVQAVQGRLDSLEGVVNGIKGQISQILGRISGLENIQGQILMDIRNIYSALSQYKRDIDYVKGQIIAIWAAIAAAAAAAAAALLAAIAGVKALIAVITKQIAAIYGQIGLLWAAIRALQLRPPLLPPSGGVRNGRDGRDGLNGKNGRDGLNGRNGLNGKNGRDGLNGRNGLNGNDGKDGKDGEDKEVELVTIQVEIFDGCDSNSSPKFKTESVSVIKGTENDRIKEYQQISKIRASECKPVEAYAAVPEWWQIRPEGKRPQLVLQFCAKLSGGKYGAPMYSITIPHPRNVQKPLNAPLPTYKKGNFEGELKLADNSKIIVNCESRAEAERVLNVLKGLVKTNMLEGSSIKFSERRGKAVQKHEMFARIVTYFEKGIEDSANFKWKKRFDLPTS